MEEEAGAVAEAEHARSSDELQHHSHFFAVVVDVVVLVDVVVVVVVAKLVRLCFGVDVLFAICCRMISSTFTFLKKPFCFLFQIKIDVNDVDDFYDVDDDGLET